MDRLGSQAGRCICGQDALPGSHLTVLAFPLPGGADGVDQDQEVRAAFTRALALPKSI